MRANHRAGGRDDWVAGSESSTALTIGSRLPGGRAVEDSDPATQPAVDVLVEASGGSHA